MHRALLLAKRDYLATVRTKGFLIGLVVVPILFGGSILGLALMRARPDIKDRRIALLDHTGLVASAVTEAARAKNDKELYDQAGHRQVAPRYIFEVLPPDTGDAAAQLLALSDRIRLGDLFAFLEIKPDALHPPRDAAAGKASVSFYSNANSLDDTRRWLADPLNEGLRKARLQQIGVDPSRFADLVASVWMEPLSLVSRDGKTGAIQPARKKNDLEGFAVQFALVMLLAMIVLVAASPLLAAVTEDKTQRVVEMLLGVATPFEMMTGKVLAAVGVSLTSSAFYVVGSILALQGMGMIGMVPFSLIPWFYFYLIADVTMLSALAAALGSACNTAQEAQNLAIILLSPVIVPLCLLMPLMRQPGGALATTLSFFPPFTPLLMLLRQAAPGGVPYWQPWVAILGIVACTLAAIWTAARIFRIGILMQGTSPRPAEVLRWAIRG